MSNCLNRIDLNGIPVHLFVADCDGAVEEVEG